jgi:hypothetical protein
MARFPRFNQLCASRDEISGEQMSEARRPMTDEQEDSFEKNKAGSGGATAPEALAQEAAVPPAARMSPSGNGIDTFAHLLTEGRVFRNRGP